MNGSRGLQSLYCTNGTGNIKIKINITLAIKGPCGTHPGSRAKGGDTPPHLGMPAWQEELSSLPLSHGSGLPQLFLHLRALTFICLNTISTTQQSRTLHWESSTISACEVFGPLACECREGRDFASLAHCHIPSTTKSTWRSQAHDDSDEE